MTLEPNNSIWAIAGHDPFGGAGVSADARVAAAYGVPLRTLITSLTAQNDQRVLRATPVDEAMFRDQWVAASEIETPAAYKIGLIQSIAQITRIARDLSPNVPLILDPVLASSSGSALVSRETSLALREYLFPKTTLLTPNRPETEQWVGYALRSLGDVQRAARDLLSTGVKAVLIKGGHSTDENCLDYFDDGEKPFWVRALRQPGAYRGTGCTLSTAIACGLAQGLDLREAVVQGHAYTQKALRTASRMGSATGKHHLPAVTTDAPLSPLDYTGEFSDKTFPRLTRPLGFYPVLPSSDWIGRLAATGVQTVQLRVKDRTGEALKAEIVRARELCAAKGIKLFINDYWPLAIELGVYGVHLGQEDLDALSPSDVETIRSSGLRLGLSTHSLEEAARALALGPSYIALGPVFETTCKSMRFGPQGIPRVGDWVRRLPNVPICAIGGLKLEHAAAIKTQGANGLAVISDLTGAEDPLARMAEWLKAFSP